MAGAGGNYGMDKGYKPAVALTKFRFVKFSAEDTVTVVTGKTDVVCGVAQYSVSTAELSKGKNASVRMEGISEVEIASTVSVGDLAGLTANGTIRTATTGDRIVGTVTHGATTAGERASVMVEITSTVL